MGAHDRPSSMQKPRPQGGRGWARRSKEGRGKGKRATSGISAIGKFSSFFSFEGYMEGYTLASRTLEEKNARTRVGIFLAGFTGGRSGRLYRWETKPHAAEGGPHLLSR